MVYPSWLEQVGNISGQLVLDLGCGGGITSRMLAKKGARVIGVDKEPKMIDIARRKEAENPMDILYFTMDVLNLPLMSPNGFDLVAPTLLLHYAKTKQELRVMIQNIAKNLKPGGRMVAINSDPSNPVMPLVPGSSARVYWFCNAWEEGAELELEAHVDTVFTFREFYYWKQETYEILLKEAGFTNIEWHPLKMTDEGKKLCQNWEELENYSLIILSSVYIG